MPRYFANATTFVWQVTTEARGGKQIGWYENWLGLETGASVFVGTELLYLAPKEHNEGLQKVVLEKVEEVLFSTGITRVAQSAWGHQPANAMPPHSSYTSEKIKGIKLQSLEDGSAVYEDSPLESNVETEKSYFVKNRPVGTFVYKPQEATVAASSGVGNVGGIDLNPAGLDLETQGEDFTFNVPLDPAILQSLQNQPLEGLSPTIVRIVPISNLPLLFGVNTPR